MRATIPSHGRAKDDVLGELDRFAEHDVDYQHGKTWSLVYWPGEAHYDLVSAANQRLLSANGLNPMAFKSTKKLETEVVQMTASMLGAPEGAVGTMTAGGTESLLCAVFAARERARTRRPWIRRPNLVIAETVHPAVDKAAHYFGIAIKRVPVDADGRAPASGFRRRIDRNTVLVIASAPSYPWGVVDPIAEIAAVTKKRGVPFHVDACFGGFILPWLERIGVAVPTWDFRIDGVTSMSADVHKYGYAPKGASVVIYRDMSYLRHQFFVATHWKGGVYASPTLAGTRPGGPMAAAWASLVGMGEDGFLKLAREAWSGSEALRAGLRAIPGLRVLGLPHSTIVTYASDDPAVDINALADQLGAAGWSVDRQQYPASIHCTVNAANGPVIDKYLADVRAAVEAVRADPSLATKGNAAIYGLLSAVPLASVSERAVRDVMAGMYAPGGAEDAGPPGGPMIERAARVLKRARDAWRSVTS